MLYGQPCLSSPLAARAGKVPAGSHPKLALPPISCSTVSTHCVAQPCFTLFWLHAQAAFHPAATPSWPCCPPCCRTQPCHRPGLTACCRLPAARTGLLTLLCGSALSQSSSGGNVQATCASSDPKLALCLVRIMLHESSLASSPHQAALLESLIALLSSWQPHSQTGQPPQVCTSGYFAASLDLSPMCWGLIHVMVCCQQ